MTTDSMSPEPCGLLIVDKPPGVSSRKIVNDVQRLVRPVKVGHAGTLDPLATGVLVLCLGRATRLVPYVQQHPKEYEATFLLGCRSDTDDIEHEVTQLPDAPIPTEAEIQSILPNFVGEIQQRPPAFSAVKVKGKRAYRLARKGATVDLAPRPVTIHELKLVDYAYPRLVLGLRCGSGTYVRSVGRDLAASLGTAAVMSALRRTAIGAFRVDDACDASTLDEATLTARLLAPVQAVSQLPSLRVSPEQIRRLSNGLRIPRADQALTGEVAALGADGRLVAILAVAGDELRPVRNFV